MNRIITKPSIEVKQPDSFEKGRLFEEYIIKLFNQYSFKLLKWRKSEKIIDGSFSLDYACPDLELVLMSARKYRFAVECKWRRQFSDGKIGWASSYQICSYEDFQDRIRIPVFVAIGIGGEPSSPEKLFVTPLCNISNYTEVFESDLIPYKRQPTHKFYYDTHQLRLF